MCLYFTCFPQCCLRELTRASTPQPRIADLNASTTQRIYPLICIQIHVHLFLNRNTQKIARGKSTYENNHGSSHIRLGRDLSRDPSFVRRPLAQFSTDSNYLFDNKSTAPSYTGIYRTYIYIIDASYSPSHVSYSYTSCFTMPRYYKS